MDVSFLTARQHELRLPTGVKGKALTSLVSSQPTGSHRSVDDAPFRRMYDFWFASIIWAEHHDLPIAGNSRSEKFVSVGPTQSDVRPDTAMLELLLLIAVRRLSPDVNSLPEASAVFKLANELAAVGAPRLIESIESRSDLMEPRLYTTVSLFRDAAMPVQKPR
jgi:hypothetical protein